LQITRRSQQSKLNNMPMQCIALQRNSEFKNTWLRQSIHDWNDSFAD
jgi:hypothetical protein